MLTQIMDVVKNVMGSLKQTLNCWNCGLIGHIQRNCPNFHQKMNNWNSKTRIHSRTGYECLRQQISNLHSEIHSTCNQADYWEIRTISATKVYHWECPPDCYTVHAGPVSGNQDFNKWRIHDAAYEEEFKQLNISSCFENFLILTRISNVLRNLETSRMLLLSIFAVNVYSMLLFLEVLENKKKCCSSVEINRNM